MHFQGADRWLVRLEHSVRACVRVRTRGSACVCGVLSQPFEGVWNIAEEF